METSALSSLERQHCTGDRWPDTWRAVVTLDDHSNEPSILESHTHARAALQDALKAFRERGVNVNGVERVRGSASDEIRMEDFFMEHKSCQWIAKVRLDADDVLAPCYFENLQDVTLERLQQTRTAKGDPWLGAVVGPRQLTEVILGKGICHAHVQDHKVFSGSSVGQTIILSRDAYLQLGRVPSGSHTQILQIVRNDVVHNIIGHKDYFSRAGSLFHTSTDNTSVSGYGLYNRSYDEEDESTSRIAMVDTLYAFGYRQLYMITPLSGHFPWGKIGSYQACDAAGITNAEALIEYDVGDLMAGAEKLSELDMIDACQSNKWFVDVQKSLFVLGEDCHQMTTRRRAEHLSPYHNRGGEKKTAG